MQNLKTLADLSELIVKSYDNMYDSFIRLASLMRENVHTDGISIIVSDRGILTKPIAIDSANEPLHEDVFNKISAEVLRSGDKLSAEGVELSVSKDVGIFTYLALPLKVTGKALGVVILLRKSGKFSEDDVDKAQIFASFCSLLLERARLYADKHLNENLQVIGMLKSSVAHDMSNLLGVVRVYLELMEQEVEKDSLFSEYIEAMKGEISRIAVLASDMLDLSKNKVNLNKKKFIISELVKELENDAKILVKDTDIKVRFKVEDDISIVADKDRLFRVFFNIIKNAVEALDGKGVIRFKAKKVKDKIYFIIMDNGMGINPENLRVLFNPFFTSGKANGTGLGLAVVKDMVYAHGGTVDVRSKQGSYTCFLIRIPSNG